MAPGEPRIVSLPARRIEEAVGVLRDAFRDDPIFAFHFPDATLRAKVFEIFFDDVIRGRLRFGHVYAAMDGGRLVGAAVWRPPHVQGETWRDRLRGLLARRKLARLSPVTRDLIRGFAALEATHPPIPHWYLFFVGIDAALRGRNLGGRLMAPVLETADATRTLCYLETPFPQTIAFYRKLGYEVSSEPRPFPGAPQLWALTRQPQAVSKIE